MDNKVVDLNINDILPNRFQPRIAFNENAIQELSNSIKEHGVIQPIVVRKIGDKYEIIAGERRYKASVLAGKQTIPAIITDLNDKDSAEIALIENVQRKDLTPIEEAISYKKILDMGLTQEELASKLGKNQSTIANKLRLLNLDDEVQEALLNEKISERHARSLLKLHSQEKQRNLLKRIIDERLTVRKTDEEIDKMNNNDIETLNYGNNTQAINSEPETLNVYPTSVQPEILNVQPINIQPEILNVQANNNGVSETVEVFDPSIETLNIPTSPIVDDSIPEVYPKVEQSTEPTVMNAFNPQPEVIQPVVSPIPEPVLTEQQGPVEQLNINAETSQSPAIPTTPIEELKLEDFTVNNPTNLGFMDINKIENEAQELYTPPVLAPVDELLESAPEMATSVDMPATINPVSLSLDNNESDDSEGSEDILVPGKFFNLTPEEENELEEVNISSVDNYNFNLDTPSNISPIKNEESYSFENSLESNLNNNDFEFPKVEDIEPQDLINPLNNYNEIHEYPIPLAPKDVHANTAISELEFPNLNPNDKFPFPTSMPESIVNEADKPLVQPISSGTDLKSAINMVRDLEEKLNKLGYVVEMEEFDFEDMYQVTFKLNK